MEEIRGTVRNIIYRNAENGYSVLELVDDAEHGFTAVGELALASIGERIEITGSWTEHPAYGKQLKVRSYHTLAPANITALINYLGSGLISGVGEVTARQIVAAFGMDTISVLESEPERLREVPGIGRKRAERIAASFALHKDLRDIMLALQDYGITVNQGLKLYRAYGNLCLAKLRENPYRLIDDIEGIGFITADKLAANAGIEHDSPFRIKAGLKYTLQWARQEGHTMLPKEKLVEVACDLLGVDVKPAEDMLDELMLSGGVVVKSIGGEDCAFLPYMFRAEGDCAKRLVSLIAHAETPAMLAIEERIRLLEKELNIELAPQQHEAVVTALSSGAMVITGGPGTGKTTILRFVIRLIEEAGLDCELCAPTGRAAKRMAEATGAEARTIHRMLGYGFDNESFVKNEDNPVSADVVIVDEMSMVDITLMRALLRATPPGARLVMVGDADQLPSVGPGNVLRDIIESGVAPVIRLTDIYRQAERGMIVENAHRINRGRLPELFADCQDFRFEELAGAEEIIRRVIALYSGATNKLVTRDPAKDVQVLSPMKKGALGVAQLNGRLQQALNPPAPKKREHKYGDVVLREGDKVMQTKNNYKTQWKRVCGGTLEEGMGVFNGDLGTVVRIDPEDQELAVLFDDEREASYDFAMLDELALAYAVTIHKSQGSEFPVVVMPLAGGPPQLLTRNLLYTAVTRAREQVYIVGRSRSVYDMVDNAKVRTRYSALRFFLENFSFPAEPQQ
ncbi:MAG TPA: ATP-dependent RecD-like DNA helicase [Clostridia bacterium]|nr:ATP-dependent RecD-like DNA helicase [Clostridia bacterium]